MAKHDSSLDLIFAALGDPTRRAIVARLTRGPASVSELASAHDMALPSFVGHLRKLEAAGIVETEKTGRVRSCRLSQQGLAPATDWLSEQRTLWEGRLDAFDDYVTELAKARSDEA
ncbi:ArsR family transcriptional regulator [Roseivivax halodurans JCM 10272]|uniref:ArsR family transcriptional regulator n=1 Tax=Roseivivax halodurans JCM 10272 TaxID=1449350 RepID=X7EIB9_9RHOB|nr:metalloregulator ArsR/SmtB family transcription factor [Roseivivax halodurans]ETX14881.1 ArsR family transcriptional regulator [Roseivivax halodurans JCM 10272]